MATIGTYLNLADLRKSLDPDGQVAKIVEILDESNVVNQYLPWKEGNLITGHQHTIRAGLPASSWGMINVGVAATKGTKVQVTDVCGELIQKSDIDRRLAELNGMKAAWRLDEDHAHIEGLSQDFESAIFYSNVKTDPEQIYGLAPRYAAGDTAGDSGTSADNVLDGGGTGSDNTSIWLVTFAPDKTFGIFPKGMQAGLKVEDVGLTELLDSDGNSYRGYRTYYYWRIGLAVADWRYNVRIANIDVSDLDTDASAGANLIELMIRAIHRVPTRGTGKRVFFVNKHTYEYLDHQTYNGSNMHLQYGKDEHGREIVVFRGTPVVKSDGIVATEEAVTFS